jgi:hypothetical protein
MRCGDLTRSALIDHMRAGRVVMGARKGKRVQVTIDLGRASVSAWVPADWCKLMRPQGPKT